MLKVYTGDACLDCKVVKDYFTENNVEFKEVNAHEDEDAMNRLLGLGLRSVPQIFRDDVLVGDIRNYRNLLEG